MRGWESETPAFLMPQACQSWLNHLGEILRNQFLNLNAQAKDFCLNNVSILLQGKWSRVCTHDVVCEALGTTIEARSSHRASRQHWERKANVLTNKLMGEGMSVYIFEMGLNVPTDLGQVCCWAQTAWLLEQTRVCTSLSF